ncbi:MBOAT family protein [Pedobacter cryotolerans]|uniref:MBOAT family protein n=1 Tax=Pedobacter cryotolerans TaxID=2571270 RepID=A0A4V5NXK0_9SPHI|nr:MBOAT family protein [Pedobacter cryotolerans]
MLVNSINFLIFFCVVFIVYYFLLGNRYKLQNLWLLLCSYFFYGFATLKMIPLLLFATIFFYIFGLIIGKFKEESNNRASVFTSIGCLTGIGLLLYFKYLNFFIESFSDLFTSIGLTNNWSIINIIMPLGISFFTFKLISYLIEINRGNLAPTKNFIDFALYISFFPTILSGPIDRPKPFLTQLTKPRFLDFEMASEGLKRIFWGMFMKMCIADRLSIYVDAIFDNSLHHNGTSIAFAVLLYPIQLYADFAGYSEMAIGVGCLLGLKVTENFKRPFFSTNIADYWRKWHISLTSWLTDYVFMPLNIKFRELEKYGSLLAIIATFVLIGFWHGAAWTFVLFGLYHGLLYVPLMLSGAFFKKNKSKGIPTFVPILKMIRTYLLVAIGLILFRSTGVEHASSIVYKILTDWGSLFVDSTTLINAIICIFILFIKDFKDEYMLQKDEKNRGWIIQYKYELTISFYIILILFMGVLDGGQFIYFKF